MVGTSPIPFSMASLLMFMSTCLASQDVIRFQAANTSIMRDAGNKLGFAVFIKHGDKYLNDTPVSVISVENPNICTVTCVGNPYCWSFNLEAKQNGERLRCELLGTDMFNASHQFLDKTGFVHFSIKSSCYPMACKHGGTCIPSYNNGTHTCQCASPYYGPSCEKKRDCLLKTFEELEKTGKYSVLDDSGSPLQVYRDATKDHNWTLIARFSNKDDKNWMKSGGSWWYDTTTAHGNTTDPFVNADMISPAFWSLQGSEIKLSRSDDPCHITLLQTVSNCSGSRTFRSVITSLGNFRTATWKNSGCLARCSVSYSGNYMSVEGFSQANCNGTIQDSQKVGFWCGGESGYLDGAVMMIGGGGSGCARTDHGIVVTETNQPKLGSGCDFGDHSSCSRDIDYALNLWIRGE